LSILDRVEKYELSLGTRLDLAFDAIEGMLSMWGQCFLDDEEDPELEVLGDVSNKLKARGNHAEGALIENLLFIIKNEVFPCWNGANDMYDRCFEDNVFEDELCDYLDRSHPSIIYANELNAVRAVIEKLKNEEKDLPTITISLSGIKQNKVQTFRGTEKGISNLHSLISNRITNFFDGSNTLGTEDHPQVADTTDELPFK